jgi:hypothetical protein
MPITVKKLEGIMLFHLEHLSTSNEAVDLDTVFGSALSSKTVVSMSARSLFKTLVRRDNKLNGGVDKPWPGDWPTLTPRLLAPQLL